MTYHEDVGSKPNNHESLSKTLKSHLRCKVAVDKKHHLKCLKKNLNVKHKLLMLHDEGPLGVCVCVEETT